MNLNTYLQQLDLAKLDLQPLNDHFIAEQLNEQEKELYLTMIGSFVLVDDLTEQRTRLFQLYLHACKTNHQQGKIFNLAQNISKDQIKEFIRLCKDKSLIESFFVDAFIFSRLDKPLTEKLNNLFDEWIALFELEDKVIETIIYFVSNTLGLKSQYQLNYILDIEKLNIWVPYCLEIFDKYNIEINKAYYVDEDINLDLGMHFENCIVLFKNKKITLIDSDLLVIKNSFFVNSSFELIDLKKINIKDSFFRGGNTHSMNLFDIKSNLYWSDIEDHVFENNAFEDINCRVLNLSQQIIINKCKFKNCGHKDIVGGVIYTTRNIRVSESEFELCIAKVAGAIYCTSLDDKNGIYNCSFNTCLSLDYQDASYPAGWNNDWNTSKDSYRGKLNAGGICIDGLPIRGIRDSTFIACNVYIKRSSHSSHSDLVYRAKFIDSILSIGDSDQNIINDCTFEKGKLRLDSNIYKSAGELKVNI